MQLKSKQSDWAQIEVTFEIEVKTRYAKEWKLASDNSNKTAVPVFTVKHIYARISKKDRFTADVSFRASQMTVTR